jgi:hypothetical protein
VTDVKAMNMSELIALHNELATAKNKPVVNSFKSLAAARSAVTNLEKETTMTETTTTEVPNGAAPVDASGGPVTTSEDRSKYNSSGMRGPNQGVGAYAKELIVAGKTNAEALAAVKEKFPNAKTTVGCIAFYRTALSKGPVGKSPEQLRAEAQALLDKAAAAEVALAEAKAKAEAAAITAAAEQPATV